MHSGIADAGGSAWSFGSSILTFAFPMLLFIVVAAALYIAYTKPELVPGHRTPANERPMTYTAVPGKPRAADGETAKPGGDKAKPGGGQPSPEGGTAKPGGGQPSPEGGTAKPGGSQPSPEGGA